MSNKRKKQQGFTIIELLISTTIFSLVLMLCIAGILQITKMYYRGVNQARTQEAARQIAEEIGESIRFSNDSISLYSTPLGPDIDKASDGLNNDTGVMCIGSKRYTFAIDRQLKRNANTTSPFTNKERKHVLWVDQPDNNCLLAGEADLNSDNPSSAGTNFDGVELLSENMRLTRFEITSSNFSAGNDVYSINITVAYGDEDLMEFVDVDGDGTSETKRCREAFVGAEFCAVSSISLTVGKRL